MYLFTLSQEYLDLAIAEIKELLEIDKKPQIMGHSLLVPSLSKQRVKRIPRLAYTKKVALLLFPSTEKTLKQNLQDFNWQSIYEKNFALRIHGTLAFKEKELAGYIWRKVKNPQVNLDNPKTPIELYFFKNKIFCCKLLWENKAHFEDRKTHKRPCPHPSSLHPKLARCLVNLANSSTIIDPFCGSGGILIEAGLLKIKAKGYDLDKIMVKRAKQNLSFYHLPIPIIQKNALQVSYPKTSAIVTDFPYGKNTKVNRKEQLLAQFLKKAKAQRLILGLPSTMPYASLIRKTRWTIKHTFKIPIHKSLTKIILILE